jgi:hypothetical protein
MNRIKIIKRANLQLKLEGSETKAKKVNASVNKREAAQVVAHWIDKWRASKPKDAKRAFADLFGSTYIPVNQ